MLERQRLVDGELGRWFGDDEVACGGSGEQAGGVFFDAHDRGDLLEWQPLAAQAERLELARGRGLVCQAPARFAVRNYSGTFSGTLVRFGGVLSGFVRLAFCRSAFVTFGIPFCFKGVCWRSQQDSNLQPTE